MCRQCPEYTGCTSVAPTCEYFLLIYFPCLKPNACVESLEFVENSRVIVIEVLNEKYITLLHVRTRIDMLTVVFGLFIFLYLLYYIVS